MSMLFHKIEELARFAYQGLISPSRRFEIREAITRLREILGLICLWRWEFCWLPHHTNTLFNILYIGRKSRRELAGALLHINGDIQSPKTRAKISDRTVFISELPLIGGLRIPHYLSAIVPLGIPIEKVTLKYDDQLRRSIKKIKGRYRLEQVMDRAEIEHIDREMLQSYATARHGVGAAQISLKEVTRIALESGRLDLVFFGDEVVGCHLGVPTIRKGKSYWTTVRFGYPAAVYSDSKRLRETNSINTYLALEWAINNGFDYYNIGISKAQPDNGLLQWKRRRGGEVDTMENEGYFYVRLPKTGAAEFLWDAPLFSVNQHLLSLNLGIPSEPSDDEVAIRYREMGYGGISKVRLYCSRPPSEFLIERIRSYYVHYSTPPVLEIIPTS